MYTQTRFWTLVCINIARSHKAIKELERVSEGSGSFSYVRAGRLGNLTCDESARQSAAFYLLRVAMKRKRVSIPSLRGLGYTQRLQMNKLTRSCFVLRLTVLFPAVYSTFLSFYLGALRPCCFRLTYFTEKWQENRFCMKCC